VRSLTYDRDFRDLRFLAPVLAGKRLVQLGESGHGVSEFSQAKVRLIKYLHEELGYDVIAFESSMFACYDADARALALSAPDMMRNCLFGVWHASEVEALFDYIRATKRTSRPLTLAGFDVQQSSAPGDVRRAAFFERLLAATGDSAAATRFAAFDSAFFADFQRHDDAPRMLAAFIDANDARLVAGYDSIARLLESNRSALEARFGDAAVAIGIRTARSMPAYFDELRTIVTRPDSAAAVRDRGMADNVDALLDEAYPGKKIIVWAHNFHVRNDGPHVAPSPAANMGSYVAQRRRAETYTVGFYMYRGTAADNAGNVYSVAQRDDPQTLESILYHARLRYSFVDVAGAARTAGSRWLWEPTVALDWGRNPYRMIVRDQYDGIFFVDTTHGPAYF
jgi:erythromycin esterase